MEERIFLRHVEEGSRLLYFSSLAFPSPFPGPIPSLHGRGRAGRGGSLEGATGREAREPLRKA
ncbi:hypothetical protein AKJ41_06155 [candidate division MSBL1 archaeon SCGC-AAA259O05]|uniref:Uncharacterized protein n=1 Tax=candidate division MSBL1 archaeon SCGC-AAA259O05 TaxID=1698271 RepID=A0A133UXU2_9EURY|nr:hypothetical protein AKJ41_06155 [candidate division MSBL1 archaeon SCGC-AAA259O05]